MKYDKDIEELRKKHNEAAKAKKSELPPKRIQNHDQQESKDVAVNINDEHITPKESTTTRERVKSVESYESNLCMYFHNSVYYFFLTDK